MQNFELPNFSFCMIKELSISHKQLPFDMLIRKAAMFAIFSRKFLKLKKVQVTKGNPTWICSNTEFQAVERYFCPYIYNILFYS